MAISKEILLVLFPGFNTLDMNGPYEVLRKTKGGDLFKITVAAESEITTSCEGVHVKVRPKYLSIWAFITKNRQRDVALDDKLISSISDYDILVIPGGTPEPVDAQVAQIGGPFLNLLAAFSKLETVETTDDKPERVLL